LVLPREIDGIDAQFLGLVVVQHANTGAAQNGSAPHGGFVGLS